LPRGWPEAYERCRCREPAVVTSGRGEEGWLMPVPDRSRTMDHMVVLFENRSLDNVLGHLFGPG
jgi:hypothetical protein